MHKIVFLLLAHSRAAHSLLCTAGARNSPSRHIRRAVRMKAELAPDHDEKVDKALKAMTGFANSYCKNTGTTYCSDLSIPAVRTRNLPRRHSLSVHDESLRPWFRVLRWCSRASQSTRSR